MRDWRLRPLAAIVFALTLAVELAAVALSWGLESRYDTILYAVYAATLAGGRVGRLAAAAESDRLVVLGLCSSRRRHGRRGAGLGAAGGGAGVAWRRYG
jgi:hypothetical protein